MWQLRGVDETRVGWEQKKGLMQNLGRKRKKNFKNRLESGKRGGAFETWLGKTRALYWSKKAQRQGSFSSAVELSLGQQRR